MEVCDESRHKESQLKWTVEESRLRLMCQWMSCKQSTVDMTPAALQRHVSHHIEFCRQVYNTSSSSQASDELAASGASSSGTAEHSAASQTGAAPADVLFQCPWYHSECKVVLSDLDALAGHCHNHVYHDKLRAVGAYIQHVEQPDAPCSITPRWTLAWPRYQCRWHHCDADTYVMHEFYEHMNFHVIEAQDDLLCRWEGCTKQFKCKAKLRTHMRCHSEQKTVVCPMCHKAFSKNISYVEHLHRTGAAVGSDGNVPSFKCGHCGKQFQHDKLRVLHMRICKRSKCHCLLCGQLMSSTSALKLHIAYKHTSDRAYVCTNCHQYSGKTPFDLQRHESRCKLQMVAGDGGSKRKVFPCGGSTSDSAAAAAASTCQFVANTLSELLAHRKQEHPQQLQDAKRYECHWCKKRYLRGNDLTTHLVKHHDYVFEEHPNNRRYAKCSDGMHRVLPIQRMQT